MSQSGELIAQACDEWGMVQVFDDGQRRFLRFGDDDEQSCWSKSEPGVLQHDYTRAMCLSLLWGEPKRVLVLGLGAGCLVHALIAQNKSCKFELVELRPIVADFAKQYFALPQSKRVNLSVCSAQDYLANESAEARKKAGLIFSDLYHGEGMDSCQTEWQFWQQAQAQLSQTGVLVVNYWHSEHLHEVENLDVVFQLQNLFDYVYASKTVSGNWIIFASQLELNPSNKARKQMAVDLSKSLGFSLLPYLSRLQRLQEA